MTPQPEKWVPIPVTLTGEQVLALAQEHGVLALAELLMAQDAAGIDEPTLTAEQATHHLDALMARLAAGDTKEPQT